MSKVVRLTPDTYNKLLKLKKPGETWTELISRLLERHGATGT
jgi:predicted CopG family antitoxin